MKRKVSTFFYQWYKISKHLINYKKSVYFSFKIEYILLKLLRSLCTRKTIAFHEIIIYFISWHLKEKTTLIIDILYDILSYFSIVSFKCDFNFYRAWKCASINYTHIAYLSNQQTGALTNSNFQNSETRKFFKFQAGNSDLTFELA